LSTAGFATQASLNGCGGHLPTLIRAALARLGATLTVFHFVLPAFGPARLAHLGAEVAEFVDEPGTAAHPSCGTKTNLRTIAIKANTFGHLRNTCVG
jgi:hypothetical protein